MQHWHGPPGQALSLQHLLPTIQQLTHFEGGSWTGGSAACPTPFAASVSHHWPAQPCMLPGAMQGTLGDIVAVTVAPAASSLVASGQDMSSCSTLASAPALALAGEASEPAEQQRQPGEAGRVAAPSAQSKRLRWSHELHARFAEAVRKLGGAFVATPKKILDLMDAPPGVTLFHVKSHLQKYRNMLTTANKDAASARKAGRRGTHDAQPAAAVAPTVPAELPPSALSRMPELSSAEGRSGEQGSAVAQGDGGGGDLITKADGRAAGGPPSDPRSMLESALLVQVEMQRQLAATIETQRKLQMELDAHGRYIETLLTSDAATGCDAASEPPKLQRAGSIKPACAARRGSVARSRHVHSPRLRRAGSGSAPATQPKQQSAAAGQGPSDHPDASVSIPAGMAGSDALAPSASHPAGHPFMLNTIPGMPTQPTAVDRLLACWPEAAGSYAGPPPSPFGELAHAAPASGPLPAYLPCPADLSTHGSLLSSESGLSLALSVQQPLLGKLPRLPSAPEVPLTTRSQSMDLLEDVDVDPSCLMMPGGAFDTDLLPQVLDDFLANP